MSTIALIIGALVLVAVFPILVRYFMPLLVLGCAIAVIAVLISSGAGIGIAAAILGVCALVNKFKGGE